MAEAATGKKRSRKGKEDDAIVMDGQTEEERRLLRQTQRELHDRMQSKKQDMTSLDSTTFENMKDDNNELFKKVRFTREAHYDAENFKLITQVSRDAAQFGGASSSAATRALTSVGRGPAHPLPAHKAPPPHSALLTHHAALHQ